MMHPLLFDVSGGELMVIMLFALLFFGSKGIPDIARTLGRTMRQVRDASNEVQREIQRGTSDIQRAVTDQRRSFQQGLENSPARSGIPPPPDPEATVPEPIVPPPGDPKP